MRGAETDLAQRVRTRRRAEPTRPAASEHVERVVEDILVAREMARVDLGVDMLITQPQE